MHDLPDSLDPLEPSWTDCGWSLFTKNLQQVYGNTRDPTRLTFILIWGSAFFGG